MPRIDRLFLDPIVSVGYFKDKDNEAYINGIQWLQFVPFAEVGQVPPSWNMETLHSDMKWSLGLGVRAWAKGIVARIDGAVSDEGGQVQMMISQPFQY